MPAALNPRSLIHLIQKPPVKSTVTQVQPFLLQPMCTRKNVGSSMYHTHMREVYLYLDTGTPVHSASPQPPTRFFWFKAVTTVAAHSIKTDHNNNHNHTNTSLHRTHTWERVLVASHGNIHAYDCYTSKKTKCSRFSFSQCVHVSKYGQVCTPHTHERSALLFLHGNTHASGGEGAAPTRFFFIYHTGTPMHMLLQPKKNQPFLLQSTCSPKYV